MKLPAGTSAKYRDDEAFDFPVGTVIAKTFAYPVDARESRARPAADRDPHSQHEADGWVGLPYIWNDEQTEAMLDVAGDHDRRQLDPHRRQRANEQLHHPQRQPVQGMPQAGRHDESDRPQGPAT